jgi:hypothetical protein
VGRRSVDASHAADAGAAIGGCGGGAGQAGDLSRARQAVELNRFFITTERPVARCSRTMLVRFQTGSAARTDVLGLGAGQQRLRSPSLGRPQGR